MNATERPYDEIVAYRRAVFRAAAKGLPTRRLARAVSTLRSGVTFGPRASRESMQAEWACGLLDHLPGQTLRDAIHREWTR